MARPDVTQDERQRIVDLLREGKSRNAIVRETGRSNDTVSRIAAQYGFTFGQSAQQKADARRAYCADARERLRLGLLAEAERLLAQLREPQTVFSFVSGGRDNPPEFMSEELEEPEPKAKRELLTAIGIAIDKAELIEKNNAGGDDGRGAMLAFFEAMGVNLPSSS